MKADKPSPSLWARLLGYGGLIPFMGLAVALWLVRSDGWPLAGMALVAYGAAISSFLGAIHWGLVMRERPSQPVPALLWGVVPSLLGWVALLHWTLLLTVAPGCFIVRVIKGPA